MTTWTTKDGKEIGLKKLKDDHLINIKQWIEKRADVGITLIEGGGFWDIDDIWYDETHLEGDDVLEHFGYKFIMREIKRRKLKVSKYVPKS